MKNRIMEALRDIERLDDVEIIYACESGSRAWGFESEDSDWDVRFIYVRMLDRYVSLTGDDSTIDRNTSRNDVTREHIRRMEKEHEIDLAGWDLKKTMNQLCRGNPVLSEWFCSPIVYKSTSYVTVIKAKAHQFYKNKAGLYHYEHMARKNFDKYIMVKGDEVARKKYLYILRPIFAMRWIDIKNTPPPMVLTDIIDDQEIKGKTEDVVLERFARRIIGEKKAGMELGKGPRFPSVDAVMGRELDEFRLKAARTRTEEGQGLDTLDPLFYNIVMSVNA